MGGIRWPSVSKKVGSHRYAILDPIARNNRETAQIASDLRQQGFSVRVIRFKSGSFIYHYPQYPRPKGWS